MLKKTTEKTVTKVEREFRVFNEQNEMIGIFKNTSDLMESFNIKTASYIYNSIKNNSSYFKPNIKSDLKIRVELKKIKTISKVRTIMPFILDESERETIINLPGEKWLVINDFGGYYSCSNKGRFKITDIAGNEKILNTTSSTNKTGRSYRDIALYPINDDGSIGRCIKYRTSRVLAKTWIDNTLNLNWKLDKRDVDHIDNNSENENIENLRVCSHSDNIRFAIYQQGKVVGNPTRKCYAYNIYTGICKEYDSTAECSEDIYGKRNPGYFHTANKNKSISKSGWTLGYDPEELKNRK